MPTAILEALTNGHFVFWGAITLICVVPSVCHYWYRIRRHELDLHLKQTMIDRGFTPDEIVRVLGACSEKRSDERSA